MKFMKKAVVFAFLAAVFIQNLAGQTARDASDAFQLGRLDRATLIYRDLTKADPSNIDHWLQLGNLQLANGATDKALESFTKAVAIDPDNALAYVGNARIALLKGSGEEAAKLTGKAIKSAKSKNANLIRQAAESYFFGKTRNIKRAIEILDEANRANTKDIPTLLSLGWAWKEVPDGGKSVTYYGFANDLEKMNPIPLFRIGQVYWQSRNMAKYEEFMLKTLEVDPGFVPAARDLGDFYYRTYKVTKAKTMYDKFIKGKDVTIEDRMQYANILFLAKEYELLVPYVEDVIKADGSRNYLRRILGYAAYETGDFDKGMGIMSDYFMKVKPENIIADDYEFYAKLLEKKGQDSLALLNYLKAPAKDPSKWRNYKSAGKLALNKLKKYQDGVTYFQINLDSLQASEKAGGEGPVPEDYYYLGVANQYIKNYVQADTMYAKVCELSPSAITGWKARAKLGKYFEPDIVETDPTANEKFGVSKKYWDKVVEIGLKDTVKNSKSLKEAYEYLYYYFFVKNDNTQAEVYVRKVLEIDPNDVGALDFLSQLEAVKAAPVTDPKQKNK